MALQIATDMDAALATLVAANNGYQSNSSILTQMIATDSVKTISAISKASPGEVTTSAAHGMVDDDLVYLVGGDMVEVAGWYTVTLVAATKFTIGVDSRLFTTYSTGGTAQLYHDDPTFWELYTSNAKTLYDAGTWSKGPSQFGDYPSWKT